MLEKERAYYEKNLTSLQENYLGKYVVISEDRVIGDYYSDEEAYAGAMEAKCQLGSFMIKLVRENQTQRFTSLVYT